MKTTYKIRVIAILIIAITSITGTEAQDIRKNSLYLNWGIGHIQRQDLTMSPFIHRDLSPFTGSIGYRRDSRFIHQAGIRFSMYNPSTSESYQYISSYDGEEYSTSPHSFFLADINYAFGLQLVERGKLEVAAGARSRNRFQFSDYSYGSSSFTGYYITIGFDIWASASYRTGERQKLITTVYVPTYSIVSRSPYLSVDDQYLLDNYSHRPIPSLLNLIERGEVQMWNQSRVLDFDLAYRYSYSNRLDLGIRYLFSMNINEEPTPFTSFENAIQLTANYKF